MSTFSALKLHPTILQELTNKGYVTPTPIQAQAIPHLLEGKDLLGIAQTGTGKTAAFSLPIINKLGQNKTKVKSRGVRALVLTPTRELASQIELNVKAYGKGLHLSSKVVFGGVGKASQIDAISRGLDILIATPGRLLDLMSENYVNFDELEVFVLDEADTMLDMGFLKDVKRIIEKLPKKRQTMLFSATMPDEIEKLANSLLNNPVKVKVTPPAPMLSTIDQRMYFLDKTDKLNLLLNLLKDETITGVLIFCKTKYGADRIVEQLERSSIKAMAIHSNKAQGSREKALGDFRSGKIKILVATDIAARGIDVSHVSHVVNLNLPEDPKNYVHRIGRTARAGRSGVAISFCVESELPLLKSIEKITKHKVTVITDHPYHRDLAVDSTNKTGVPVNTQAKSQNSHKKKKKKNNNGRRRF